MAGDDFGWKKPRMDLCCFMFCAFGVLFFSGFDLGVVLALSWLSIAIASRSNGLGNGEEQ